MNTTPKHVELRIVDQGSIEFGGEYAVAHFPERYEGMVCLMSVDNIIAIVPNVPEALRIVSYAIQPCRGYGCVSLFAAEGSLATHHDSFEWLG